MESLDLSCATYIDTATDTDSFVQPAHVDADHELASDILKEVLLYRRTPQAHSSCEATCPSCQSPHLLKVVSAIKAAQTVTFVLPAFPGKSPNLAKVLSPLPDMAEQLALQFLEQLCDRINAIYEPGAKIILCSDGRVFSDVVGMQESDVTQYQLELDKMIQELDLRNISTFNLDEIAKDKNFVEMREELMETFGMPLESLRTKIVRGALPHARPEEIEAHRMYCGITRFLVEDSTYPGQTKTRTAIQKECKVKAYEVIRRSNAWSELLEDLFPEAVRLSIHPQTCGAKKLGIRLIGTESWMTPWHGVAVKTKDEFVLLKRSEAESLGGQLMLAANGRPSHFEIPTHQLLPFTHESSEV